MNGVKSRSASNSPCILVVNFHSAQNAGDAALLEMNLRQLRAGFDHPRFLISANYPDEPFLRQFPDAVAVPSAFSIVRNNQGVSVFRQILSLFVGVVKVVLARFFHESKLDSETGRNWDALIRAFRSADLVVAVSGNQFLSMGKYGWPFPLTAFPVWAAHWFHKPFYVMPQSIGPFKRGWERFIITRLYGMARKVYLRDQVSLDVARQLGLPADRVHFAPDPAFALEPASRAEAEAILTRFGYYTGQPALGMTVIAPLARVMDASLVRRYHQSLAAALTSFIQACGARVYIFNQVTGPTALEDDRTAGRALLNLLPAGQSQVVMVDEVLSPAQLKACYACMDLMVASRLHSGIFAMGAGVATLSIGYFTKSRGLMQAMGMEEWLIELKQADAEAISKKLDRAWAQHESLAYTVKVKADGFSTQVLPLGSEIRKDYEDGSA